MIIGLAGLKGAGKDTVADYICEQDRRFCKISFAREVKDICKDVFHLPEKYLHDCELKEAELPYPIKIDSIDLISIWKHITSKRIEGFRVQKPVVFLLHDKFLHRVIKTPRELMQFVGTDVIRNYFSPDFHILSTLDYIKSNKLWNVVIPDARFKNERDAIRKHGGKIFLIKSTLHDRFGLHDIHESENDLDYDYDGFVYNDKIAGVQVLHEEVHNKIIKNIG